VHPEMLGDLPHGVNAAEEGASHGLPAVREDTGVIAERPGEMSALDAGDFPQPVHCSPLLRESLDEANAHRPENGKPVPPVLMVPVDRLTAISAGGHMVDTACKLNAKGSGHATKDRPSMPHHET